MHRIRVSLGPYGDWLKMRDEDEAGWPPGGAAGRTASVRLLWREQAGKVPLRVNKQEKKRHRQLAERGMRWGQAGLCSGGLGRASDLGPGPEGLGASAAVFGS